MNALLKDNKIIAKLRSFFEGAYYHIALGVVAILCYVCALPVFALAIFALTAAFICFFCESTRPALANVLLVFLTFRYRYDGAAYTTKLAFFVYGIVGAILLSGMIFRLIKTGDLPQRRTLLFSFLALAAAYFLGGVGSAEYSSKSFLLALADVGIFLGIYLFFSFTLTHKEDDFLYFSRICAVALCVMCLQMLDLYLRVYEKGMALDSDFKEYKVRLGWAISNHAGELMTMLLPAIFYLIYKEKHGYWYYAVLAISCIAIYFTLCRVALLCAFVIVVAGIVVNCIFHPRKRLHIILALSLLVAMLLFLLLLFLSGKADDFFYFFFETGFSDRGRYKLWSVCMDIFKENPVFGVSFSIYPTLEVQAKVLSTAHNTIIQMLSGTGIIGTILYCVHRTHTVWLVLRKPTLERLFMAACVLTGLVMGLVSSMFFLFYFLFYYAVILTLMEKSVEAEPSIKGLWEEKRLNKKKQQITITEKE